MQKLRKR